MDTILVSVAPPDGPAIAAALRDRGFAVIEAPLQLLGARALGEPPQVMIVDLDPPGALEIVARARAGAPRAELLCVGDLGRAAQVGLSREDGRAFERPIDVEALLLAVVALAEPAIDLQKLGSVPSLQPEHARELGGAPETSRPGGRSHSDVPPSGFPASISDPLEVAAILPAFDDPESVGAIAPIEVSPELLQILEAAEQRVSGMAGGSPSSLPSPDEELDMILPAELLASLDEPLDPDDDPGATGGSAPITGTGFPRPRATCEGTPRPTGTTTGPSPGLRADDAGPSVERVTSAETAAGRVSTASGRPAPPHTRVPTSPEIPAPLPEPPRPAPSSRPPPEVPRHAPEPRLAAPTPVALSAVARAPEAAAPAFGSALPLPAVLGPGEPVRALAVAIAGRASGALALGAEPAVRRIVLHDGDVVTAASSAPEESLVAFLAARGDLPRDVAARLTGRLPAFGRHAGAALIAHGHLGQDDLWPVLRAHAEWVLGRALLHEEGTCELSLEPPGRLKAEPNVFGGATGAEVMLESIRRVIPPEEALRRLGGPHARLAPGPRGQLLAECALAPEDEAPIRGAEGRTVGELLTASPELADVLYGLVQLGVLTALAPSRDEEPPPHSVDPLDAEAVRARVRARLALVEEGDYFSLLGVPHGATAYEIRRAYVELRRAFEPSRVLTAQTADLAGDVRLVIEVLDEAWEILREPHRRERYRRAIEAAPS